MLRFYPNESHKRLTADYLSLFQNTSHSRSGFIDYSFFDSIFSLKNTLNGDCAQKASEFFGSRDLTTDLIPSAFSSKNAKNPMGQFLRYDPNRFTHSVFTQTFYKALYTKNSTSEGRIRSNDTTHYLRTSSQSLNDLRRIAGYSFHVYNSSFKYATRIKEIGLRAFNDNCVVLVKVNVKNPFEYAPLGSRIKGPICNSLKKTQPKLFSITQNANV